MGKVVRIQTSPHQPASRSHLGHRLTGEHVPPRAHTAPRGTVRGVFPAKRGPSRRVWRVRGGWAERGCRVGGEGGERQQGYIPRSRARRSPKTSQARSRSRVTGTLTGPQSGRMLIARSLISTWSSRTPSKRNIHPTQRNRRRRSVRSRSCEKWRRRLALIPDSRSVLWLARRTRCGLRSHSGRVERIRHLATCISHCYPAELRGRAENLCERILRGSLRPASNTGAKLKAFCLIAYTKA